MAATCYPIKSYDLYDDERFTEYEVEPRSNYFEQMKYDSEEDTDDASETEFRHNNRNQSSSTNSKGNNNSGNNKNGNAHELKEQMYQHKLEILNKQIDELHQLKHPDFQKRLKKLESQCKDRLRLNETYRDYLKDCVERDYVLEQKAALKEYDEKKVDLKDNILADFEERKKVIESERYTLELTNDSTEIKPTVTRKLRRRPNEPVPVVEKRRKPTTGQMVIYLLDEKEVDHDLKAITRGKPPTPNAATANYVETRIEDGKLLYERRWFHRGQQVYVEGKDVSKFAATITAIGNEVVWVKKVTDSKFKINMSQLAKGKISIKRRAN